MPDLETVDVNDLATTAALAKVLGVEADGTTAGRALAGLGSDLASDATARSSLRGEAYLSVKDFGAIGDGVTDDAAAWNAAIAATVGGKLLARPGAVYRVDSQLTLPNGSIDIDLQGATILSVGNHRTFASAHNNVLNVTTISSGASARSRTITVASASGMSEGRWLGIASENYPTEDALSYPTIFVRVSGVSGTTVTLDEAIPCDFAGTVYAAVYSSLPTMLKIRNGVIDGAQNTYNDSSGQGVYASQYVEVDLKGIHFRDFDNNGTNTTCALIYTCKRGKMNKITVDRMQSKAQALEFQDVEIASAIDCTIDGDGFGLQFFRALHATAERNTITGRHVRNINESVSPLRSVRGIKTYGCWFSRICGNVIRDYSSPIKIESGGSFDVSNNWIGSTIGDGSGGGVGINVSSHTPQLRAGNGTIKNNTIADMYVGIAVQDPLGSNDISSNTIKNMEAQAIDLTCPNNTICNNRIYNWSTGSSVGAGIRNFDASGRDLLEGNLFSHTTNTQICIYSASPNVRIGVNRVLTNNKLTALYTATALHEEVGAEVRRSSSYLANLTGDFTAYVLKCDEETRNIGGCYNSGNGRFKSLLPGVYSITGSIRVGGLTASHQYVIIELVHRNSGGTEILRKTLHYKEVKYLWYVDNQVSFALHATLVMAAGDTIEVELKATDGAANSANKVVGVYGKNSALERTWVTFQRSSPT